MDRTTACMTFGGIGRLAYGLTALLAPAWMASARLAPEIGDEPEARLCLRGFGGLQVSLGTFTILARHSPELRRPVSLLNMGVDTADLTAGALEWLARRRCDRTVAGSLAINLFGLTLGAVALSRA